MEQQIVFFEVIPRAPWDLRGSFPNPNREDRQDQEEHPIL
jgi:hypothetical protein